LLILRSVNNLLMGPIGQWWSNVPIPSRVFLHSVISANPRENRKWDWLMLLIPTNITLNGIGSSYREYVSGYIGRVEVRSCKSFLQKNYRIRQIICNYRVPLPRIDWLTRLKKKK
jgi:hypothetical protein